MIHTKYEVVKMKVLNNKRGLTLIEVLVSMAILGFIAVALLSMFTSAFMWIHSAGDKSIAVSEAQGDLEGMIASGEAYEYEEDEEGLQITFQGGQSFKVPGGVIQSYQEFRDKNSELETFIPYVANISLGPSSRREGAISSADLKVSIVGTNTNFNTSTEVSIYDKTGNTMLYSGLLNGDDVVSETEIVMELPKYLINSRSYYIVRVETLVNGELEVARARYYVSKPNYIIAGNNGVYSSAIGDTSDPSTWLDRHTVDPFPNFTKINGGTFGGDRYILVGDAGKILVSQDQKPWGSYKVTGEPNLMDATWSTIHRKYLVAGGDGRIYVSDSGTSWTSFNTDATVLNGINTDPERSRIVAVGANDEGEGIIVTSNDESSWNNSYTFSDVGELNGILHYYDNVSEKEYYIAVGDNGAIITSNNGTDWNVIAGDNGDTESPDLRDVAYNGTYFVIVGDGVIISLAENFSINNTESTAHDLYDIQGRLNEFRAVGINGDSESSANGVFLEASDLNFSSWTSKNLTEELYTIIGRVSLD